MNDIKEALRRHLAAELALSPAAVTDDRPLFSSGLLDSLSVMDFVLFVEAQSGCTVPPVAITLENFDTIGLVAAFVEGLAQKGEG